VYFRCCGYHYYEGKFNYIKPLPLSPHRCRWSPHQLPLVTAICKNPINRKNDIVDSVFIRFSTKKT